MEIIEHLQQGSLPTKMVNLPKNIEAAKALADKYEELAEAGGVDDVNKLHEITGFGSIYTCKLCDIVTKVRGTYCNQCLHFNGKDDCDCLEGESKPTYDKLKQHPTPENLRARASYLRSVINKFE